MRGKPVPLLYMMLAILISTLGISIAGVIYTNYATTENTRQNNKQWCDFLTPIEDGFHSSQPTSEFGRKIGESTTKLLDQFECRER